MILSIFESYQKEKNYKNSEEYKFYLANLSYLASYPWLKKYMTIKDDFSLICTNIVIQALINKKVIETTYDLAKLLVNKHEGQDANKIIEEELTKIKLSLPYLEKNDMKLYIPIFDLSTNLIYEQDIYKIDNYPYSLLKDEFKDVVVNPFETYNTAIFNSPFTRLIYLTGDNTCDAYYHLVFETIYFINKQGSLDFIIPLFDKKMRNPIKEDTLRRVKIVADAYFKSSRCDLIDALYNNGLISSNLYRRLYKDVSRRYQVRYRVKGRK
jgi:hypothetical protein